MQACRSDKPSDNKYQQPKLTKALVAAATRKQTSNASTCPVCHVAHRTSECVKLKDINVESSSSDALKLRKGWPQIGQKNVSTCHYILEVIAPEDTH